MADIFISYSQKSPEATDDLAKDLISKGYTVWFDTRRLPMDAFWKVIRDEIEAAKAVIAIWSPRAVESERVYAEAKMAHEMKKLICVRTPDVSASDAPKPFNRANVTSVDERAKIYEALAKLGLEAGKSAPLAKEERDVTEVTMAWSEAKASGDATTIEAFIAHYGDRHPFFTALAEARLEDLSPERGAALVAELPADAPLAPEVEVLLRIDPGMHTAPIRRIGVNAAGTLMATGSEDKTARLWALPQNDSGAPALLRTLRVPIGEGAEGKVYAVAMSPDGRWVAAAGYNHPFDHWVYIFQAAAGRLITRLGRIGNVVNHLAFSPDGSLLAATLGGGEGIRLWETEDWRLLAEDKEYGGKPSYGAAFDGANRLCTVAFDGQIRRYGADGALEASAAALGGKEPFSVAARAQDGRLAIGFDDSTAIEVYDAINLERLYSADTSGISGGCFYGVAWSDDGARLYAGKGKRAPFDLFIWQDEGRGERSEAPLAQNTVMQLLPCGDGVAVGAGDPAFGLIAPDGAKRAWRESVIVDMRDNCGEALTLSGDGGLVRFGLGLRGEQPVLFDLQAFQLSDAAETPANLAPSKTTGLPVTDWENNAAPKLNGKRLALKNNEPSRALAIAPDASRFVLGAEWSLRAYGAHGGELWQKPVPGAAWGVTISRNGKLVAAAYGDGSIRWHRLSDGEELLALFVHARDRRFIAWTPEGYYAASPGADDLIGWHVNRGYEAAPDFYPASAFGGTFNRPDIVKAALDDANAAPLPPLSKGLLGKIRKWF